MARNDSFRVRWASNPAQFEKPQTSLIERGWAGGANEDPPEAKWENWWHNRVDEALAEVEANGALNWQPDVPYEVGATVRDDGVNWICAIPNNDIRPSGGANDGHWLQLAAQATESEFGAVRLADAATAQGLTDASRALTPATLAAVLGEAATFGSNGYAKLPVIQSGELKYLMIQMGKLEVTGGTPVDVTLPAPFDSNRYAITALWASLAIPGGSTAKGVFAAAPKNETQFTLSPLDASGNFSVQWITVGWGVQA